MAEQIKIVKHYRSSSKSYGWSRSTLDMAFYNPKIGIRVKADGDNRLGDNASLDIITEDQIKKLDGKREYNDHDTSGDTSFHEYVEKTTTHFEEFGDLVKLVSGRKIENGRLERLINDGKLYLVVGHMHPEIFLSGLYDELKT